MIAVIGLIMFAVSSYLALSKKCISWYPLWSYL